MPGGPLHRFPQSFPAVGERFFGYFETVQALQAVARLVQGEAVAQVSRTPQHG
jgi:hypothetical protein